MNLETCPISVVIIAQDCEHLIADAVQSAKFAAEVLVLDGGSKDDTIAIARNAGARVECRPFDDFGAQKQAAVDLAVNDWVFILDSDERISRELKDSIINESANFRHTGYLVPRLNYFFGKPVRRMGLYPDEIIRLFNRKSGILSKSSVHEKVNLSRSPGRLKGDIVHYAYDSIHTFIDKQNRYSSMGASRSVVKAVFSPIWTFFRLYFLQLGFLEGWNGYIIARLYSQYTFWKYIKSAK